MAGGTAGDAVEARPDIDFLTLATYTAGVTAVEVVTEKLSEFLLGGSFIDKTIFGKAGKTTKLGEWAGKSWVTRVLGDTLSEGLEESISEFADTALFNLMIAQGDNTLRKNYSISDILYAGIIGGAIGGIMGGGRIATTSKYVVTKDGQVMTKSDAKTRNLEIAKELTKTETLKYKEKLSRLTELAQTSKLTDVLTTKYEGQLTAEQLKQLHPEEYYNAVAYDKKNAKEIVDVVMTLAKVHSVVGDAKFKELTELANATIETAQRLADNYVSGIKATDVKKRYVEMKAKQVNGVDTSFKIVDGLITNFHLPESTLLMLVSALESVEEIKQIYQVAVNEKYRFFSFGDAMLLL
jgi:hypothetical protein